MTVRRDYYKNTVSRPNYLNNLRNRTTGRTIGASRVVFSDVADPLGAYNVSTSRQMRNFGNTFNTMRSRGNKSGCGSKCKGTKKKCSKC